MSAKEVKDMLQAKLICMELDGLSCVGKGCDHDCDDCEYNYAQGNIGEQKEALKMAIEALEKQIPKKVHRNYEKLSWKWCLCGWCLKGYEEGKNYCPNCGQALDWSEEE